MQVSFVFKECTHIKSRLSADYILNTHSQDLISGFHNRVCAYLFTGLCYTTDWIISSILKASHGSVGEKLPYTQFTLPPVGLSEAEEPPVSAGDIQMFLCVLKMWLRIPGNYGNPLACFTCHALLGKLQTTKTH